MKPVTRALADATRRLEAVSDTHRLDAELLMAAALEIERDTLLLNAPAGPVPDNFAAMLLYFSSSCAALPRWRLSCRLPG